MLPAFVTRPLVGGLELPTAMWPRSINVSIRTLFRHVALKVGTAELCGA
jgi:hypothetical protein